MESGDGIDEVEMARGNAENRVGVSDQDSGDLSCQGFTSLGILPPPKSAQVRAAPPPSKTWLLPCRLSDRNDPANVLQTFCESPTPVY